MTVPSSTSPQTLPLTVILIARNEEVNLPDCLHSVRSWVDQIVVVLDPRTTDRTRSS